MADRTISVGLWPAWRKGHENPYTVNFAEVLESEGLEVHEFWGLTVLRSYQVLIVHWPEAALNRRNRVMRLAGSAATLALIGYQRVRGARVVWIAHNETPHEGRPTVLSRAFYRALIGQLDGVVHLSQYGREAWNRRSARLLKLPSVVVPHGPYRVSEDIADRNQDPGLHEGPQQPMMVTWFGQVRAYKGVEDLITAFTDIEGDNVRLRIVGACRDEALAQRLVEATSRDGRITIDLRRLPEQELSRIVRGSHLAVFPYNDVTHSGSAIYALSHGVPIMAPLRGGITELADEVGPAWVLPIEGRLERRQLEAGIEWAGQGPRGSAPDFTSRDWDDAGAEVVKLLSRLSVP